MKRPLSLTGIAVSPGVAVGRAVLWVSREDTSPRRTLEPEEIPDEIERFRRAAAASVAEIEETARHVKERLGSEYAGIFHAHALFLQDKAFVGPVERRIVHDAANAEWAVAQTTEDLVARFRSLPDENLRDRASDLDDVSRVLRRHLGGEEQSRLKMSDLAGEAIVLVADELTPSDAVRIPRDRVIAFVTERGGKTSHAAILARSFGLPAVVAVHGLLTAVGDGDRVVVDGRDGVVWREPSEDIVSLFRDRRDSEARRELSLKERALSGPAHSADGTPVEIRANIELTSEIPDVVGYGADGVGLFRSEFLYLSKEGVEFPTEEEQAAVYREVVSGLAPRPVVIRTYDLGGKKGARHLVGAEEINPVLGLRGVRLCFARPEMFMTQLRALLAAANAGDLRILVPMVSSVEEFRRVRELVKRAREEVLAKGIAVPDDIPLGAMIEVPSAAITADLLAPETDFLALGTNDLIQYTLAVDRANETVSELFRPTHPAVLRLIAQVASAAQAARKPLSVCGEMAADPALLLLFLGFGIREFSMGARSVPILKDFVRGVNVADAARIAKAALSLSTADEVSSLLAQELRSLPAGEPLRRLEVSA
ncbi:MAG TPA: phosphoenolpyruvate--protein phosphotransferase [Thermoanaerobaculia bacterium]|nr:phosphoenolpyruvate--protein phosphotransferase [Thermoanaerobaculia bacterium]